MEWLQIFAHQYPFVVYPILSLATIIEMNATLLVSGFLLQGNTLSFLPLFISGTLGSVLHDILFWKLGRRLARARTPKKYFHPEKLQGFFDRITPMMGLFVFFSKFIWNFNRLVLLSSGYLQMDFWKFLRITSVASFVWTFILLSIGSTVANETALFDQHTWLIGLVVAGTIALVLLIQWAVRRFVIHKFFNHPSN